MTEATKMSAMEEQWEFFVASAKDKAESHTRASRFWGRVDTFFGLSLIFLSAGFRKGEFAEFELTPQQVSKALELFPHLASTTALALLEGVPKEVVAGIGAVSTMLAAAASFLKSADRRQLHEKTSRGFRSLMVKMISCESEKDYVKYWADFNREIMDEPIMPKKYTKKFRMRYTMTPELKEIVGQKELAIAEVENKKLQEQEAAEQAAERLAQKEAENCVASPRKDKWQSILEIPDISSMPQNLYFKQQLDGYTKVLLLGTPTLATISITEDTGKNVHRRTSPKNWQFAFTSFFLAILLLALLIGQFFLGGRTRQQVSLLKSWQ